MILERHNKRRAQTHTWTRTRCPAPPQTTTQPPPSPQSTAAEPRVSVGINRSVPSSSHPALKSFFLLLFFFFPEVVLQKAAAEEDKRGAIPQAGRLLSSTPPTHHHHPSITHLSPLPHHPSSFLCLPSFPSQSTAPRPLLILLLLPLRPIPLLPFTSCTISCILRLLLSALALRRPVDICSIFLASFFFPRLVRLIRV